MSRPDSYSTLLQNTCLALICFMLLSTRCFASPRDKEDRTQAGFSSLNQHVEKSARALSRNLLIAAIPPALLGATLFAAFAIPSGGHSLTPIGVVFVGGFMSSPFIGAVTALAIVRGETLASLENFNDMHDKTSEERKEKKEMGEKMLRSFKERSLLFRMIEGGVLAFAGIVTTGVGISAKSYAALPVGAGLLAASAYRFASPDTPEVEYENYIRETDFKVTSDLSLRPIVAWNADSQNKPRLVLGLSVTF